MTIEEFDRCEVVLHRLGVNDVGTLLEVFALHALVTGIEVFRHIVQMAGTLDEVW